MILAIFNFTPVPRDNYRVGVPRGGAWVELLNSDAELYGGSNMGNAGGVAARNLPRQGREFSLSITLPPLSIVGFRVPH